VRSAECRQLGSTWTRLVPDWSRTGLVAAAPSGTPRLKGGACVRNFVGQRMLAVPAGDHGHIGPAAQARDGVRTDAGPQGVHGPGVSKIVEWRQRLIGDPTDPLPAVSREAVRIEWQPALVREDQLAIRRTSRRQPVTADSRGLRGAEGYVTNTRRGLRGDNREPSRRSARESREFSRFLC
jgi:hypothetical protein